LINVNQPIKNNVVTCTQHHLTKKGSLVQTCCKWENTYRPWKHSTPALSIYPLV